MTPRADAAGAARRPRCSTSTPLLDDPGTRIIVCCGSGGVGKTTTAAALGLRAAERGRTVVVLTIDPARRLAQSMGLDRARQHPAPGARGRRRAGGRLDAMMLDMKRTFDEVVEAHADAGARPRRSSRTPSTRRCRAPSPARRSTWRWRSSGQLRARAEAEPDGWDLIVVDTPPSPVGARLPRRAGSGSGRSSTGGYPAAVGARARPAAGPTCSCVSAGGRRRHRRC